ncbi:hypothetical protein EYU69_22110 [Escherichia coli]|nr:hypothetical protein [Escherichia coli]UKR59113.1 hypothetical protein F1748_25570 [Escherichia coli]
MRDIKVRIQCINRFITQCHCFCTGTFWRIMSRTVQKWFFRNLGGRKWMKLSGRVGSLAAAACHGLRLPL